MLHGLITIISNGQKCLLLFCLLLVTACQSYQQQNCLALKPPTDALNLSRYKLVINQKKLISIQNLSGLTWSSDTKTLFAVTNKLGEILELSVQGDLLRTINTRGIRDAEAIEYLGNNQFIVADERFQKIILLTIDKQTTFINAHQAPQLTVSELAKFNRGLEGLAYASKTQKIYAANESDPVRIYEINQFFKANQQAIIIYQADKDKQLSLTDISGLHFHQTTAHLLVLSDESKLVLELSNTGQAISCLPLTSGHQGLTKTIRQPEGIALDDEDNLYIVSEPNLFYKFTKQPSKHSL